MSLDQLRMVVWDMDGTLTERGSIDFKRMRRRCKVPDGEDIIAFVRSRPPSEQGILNEILVEEERLGIKNQRLRAGAGVAVSKLRGLGVS